MSPIRTARPYAAKAIVEHEFDTDHLNVFITFRFTMDQTRKPQDDQWLVNVDEVLKPVHIATWQDEWTLLLLVPNIDVRPDRVTLEYASASIFLRTTWQKQWEPWGPIVSIELPPVSTTRIFSTGPEPQDNVDVSNVNILFIDPRENNITIGGFVGGVNGQVLHITTLFLRFRDITLEHEEGTGNQDIVLHKGEDETLFLEYGGWTLVCDGSKWYDVSHAKHV